MLPVEKEPRLEAFDLIRQVLRARGEYSADDWEPPPTDRPPATQKADADNGARTERRIPLIAGVVPF